MVSTSLLLDQNGQYLSVTDEVIRRLGELVGRRLVTHDHSCHGTVVCKETTSLLRAADGSRIPNAGLFPALEFLAQRRGLQLRRRMTPAIVSLPAPVGNKFLLHPQIAQFVFQHPLGRIGIHPGIKPDSVIQDIAFAFPNARIVVLGDHARQLARIAKALKTNNIHAWSITTRNSLPYLDHLDDDERPRVLCSTPTQAAAIDFATTDIVILLDASACHHAKMHMALSQIDARFRLYGLIDVARTPAPAEVDAMMATFGPENIRIQSPGQVRRQVHVAWIPTQAPEVDLDLTAPDFGPRSYWRNPWRNRRIKQLVNGLRSSNPLNRRRFGDLTRHFGHAGYPSPAVTILVDRPIHAAALSRILPNWPVIAPDESLEGLDENFCNSVRRHRRQWLDGSQQIVLASAAPQFRGETSDVIVWAGGGSAIDAIPRRWLNTSDRSNKPLLIVDFLDGHNRIAKRLSQHRRREYRNHDMFPVGISAAQGQLAMFLARQPGAHQ